MTRSLISRTVFLGIVVMPSVRRHCEERSDEAIHGAASGGLGCFASLAMTMPWSLPALPLFHAGIERVARGVADQIDAEDGDREQKPRPEDQRRLDQEILAAFGHDVA